MTKFELSKDGKQMLVTLDLYAPVPSSTGKSCSVAGTGGFADTGLRCGNYPIRCSINTSVNIQAVESKDVKVA